MPCSKSTNNIIVHTQSQPGCDLAQARSANSYISFLPNEMGPPYPHYPPPLLLVQNSSDADVRTNLTTVMYTRLGSSSCGCRIGREATTASALHTKSPSRRWQQTTCTLRSSCRGGGTSSTGSLETS